MKFEVKEVNDKGEGYCVVYPDDGPSFGFHFHGLTVSDEAAFTQAVTALAEHALAAQLPATTQTVAPEIAASLGFKRDPPQKAPSDPQPLVKQFEGALKAYFANNLAALNLLMSKYPLFLWSLRDQNWVYVEQMLIGAKAANDLTQADYDAIKAAAADKFIPITLP